ncbi:hypothetical protein ABZ835_47565 [Streptomyces sp. NPDC047461]|uniref:hypothetical protein n=1 Tax=unclassified Streptomyces TaxID=2593676 RepID=UPI003247D9F6
MSEPEGNYMRVARMIAGSTALVTAAVGLGIATAGPASADIGAWALYGNTNPITNSPSYWACASTVQIDTSVGAQVCAVRSESWGSSQVAVIVRNNRDSVYHTSAAAHMYNWSDGRYVKSWSCSSTTGVAANSWSVCFGKTLPGEDYVYAKGSAGGHDLGKSPAT